MSQTNDTAAMRVELRGTLEKRDASGDIFEIVEIGCDEAGNPTQKVTYSRPGASRESYTPAASNQPKG